MEKMILKLKNKRKIMIYTFLLSVLLLCIMFTVKLYPLTSMGADTTTIMIKANLEKYINYYLSEQDKGTLVQYEIKTKIEYGEEFLPVDESETIVNLGQINGQYPYEVKVITDDKTVYDATTGTLLMQANNQNESTYVVICYYDTYTAEKDERELEAKVAAKSILSNEENTQISSEEQYNNLVTDNIGELISIDYGTQDIYNGYIKSNLINGTNYATQYEQTEQIIVSKKEAEDTIEMLENNTFIKTQQNTQGEEISTDLGNNQRLVYKSTQIQKTDIERLLGEEGTLEILDIDENVIATIDKNTEFKEDGTFIINYENEQEAIIIRTSNIMNEGILNIKHTKEIKSTMTDVQNVSIKTTIQMKGIENIYEIMNGIKEVQTIVDMNISNTNWSNQQQNEVTFDIYLDSSMIKNNMFKNPSLQIEFPSQVEKVVLGDSSIVYANGLELQTPYLETNENGNLVMLINLTGAQTKYDENTLGLVTDIKIVATVILDKNMESATETVKMAYTNQYTLDGSTETGNKEISVQLENYREENAPTLEETSTVYNTVRQLTANASDLTLKVVPIKGNTTIKDGDIVYEGEYIKYNIKVTNTSEEDIDNVTVVATIPDGVTYGELEADYYNYRTEYKYNFNEELTEKTIEIGKIKAGESISKFYEVKVNDLKEEEETKSIVTKINSYVGEELAQNYEITNTIKPSEVQLFMESLLDYGGWKYGVNLISEEYDEVTVKIHLPQEFKLESIVFIDHNVHYPAGSDVTGDLVYTNYADEEDQIENIEIEISDDNIITTTLQTNCYYTFGGQIDTTNIDKKSDISIVELTSYAEAIVNDNTYTSNENRIEVSYENVKVSMTSDNEGEKVKYGEKIDYEIKIENIGGTNETIDKWIDNVVVKLSDFLPEEVEPVTVTYDNWEMKPIETGGGYIIKTEDITKDISGKSTDENGNKIADVNISILIPKGETATVKVETTAGLVYQETSIENSATVSGDEIEAKTTNTIAHTILPYNYDEEEIDDSDDSDNPDDSGNIDDGEDNKDQNKPSESNYSISGIAWVDKNEDGKRSSDEKVLSGITVILVNMLDSSTVKSMTETNDIGRYEFSNLEEGNYLVIFKYDTNTYKLTEYQKSGVSTSNNSDAISKSITLDGEHVVVGITDSIKLNQSATNIDIGLIENKLCDFKIDKYINKITVKTTSGTKEYNYDNKSLVKTEIKAKEIEGSTVTIEYKVVITNEGEATGTVNKIVDYLPDGLSFSSNLNANWTKNTNGELINTTISNKKIGAGERIELTLIATKKMTANSTGTFTNKASITETTDANTENNTSSADVIISVSTGTIVYVVSIISILGILSLVIIYLYKKGKINIKKFSKTTFLAIFLMIMILASSANVLGYTEEQSFDRIAAHYFKGGPTGHGYCQDHDLQSYSTNGRSQYMFTYRGLWDEYYNNERTTSEGDFVLTQKLQINGGVNMTSSGNNYIFGPFEFNCSNQASYSCEVKDKNGNTISQVTVCNSRGTEINLSGAGDKTFYIKIPKSNCTNGISRIDLEATGTVYDTIKKDHFVMPYYKSKAVENSQRVRTDTYLEEQPYINTSSRQVTHKITWTDINGCLEITKVDKDDYAVKLPNVKIRIKHISTNSTYERTTGSDGKVSFENIPSGRYKITEISNPNYGYDATATATVSVRKGNIKNI